MTAHIGWTLRDAQAVRTLALSVLASGRDGALQEADDAVSSLERHGFYDLANDVRSAAGHHAAVLRSRGFRRTRALQVLELLASRDVFPPTLRLRRSR